MPAALLKVAQVLKPGGHVLLRDYAEGDLAQVGSYRFSSSNLQKLILNCIGIHTEAFVLLEACTRSFSLSLVKVSRPNHLVMSMHP